MNRLIEYFVRHKTASNIAMILSVALGLFCLVLLNVQQWPTYIVNRVTVDVSWRGATSSAMDQEVGRPLALALNTLDNVHRVRTYIRRGYVRSRIDFKSGTEMQAGFAAVQGVVASINSFPDDIDQPRIRLHTPVERVSRILVTGDFSERTAASLADDIVSRIRQRGISNVRIRGVLRSPYVVEVDPALARRYGVTLTEIANSVRAAMVSSSGALTDDDGRQQSVQVVATHRLLDLADIPVSNPSRAVLIGDIARVERKSKEKSARTVFENGNGFFIEVMRNPNENLLDIADSLDQVVAQMSAELPDSIEIKQYQVRADTVRQRIGLLLSNGLSGLLLVALTMFLFLNLRAAIWVTVGIPSAFAISFIIMWMTGQTINMISVFAMVMIIGIIVDDAIVVAESIAMNQAAGMANDDAAVRGAIKVFKPVLTATLTTLAAFAPIMTLTDSFGSFVKAIPLFVCAALIASVFECFILLPGHMKSRWPGGAPSNPARFQGLRTAVDQRLSLVAQWVGKHFVEWSLRRRYLSLIGVSAVLLLAMALVFTQAVSFRFWLSPPSNFVYANLTLISGAGQAESDDAVRHYWRALRALESDLDAQDGQLIKATFGQVGRHFGRHAAQDDENLAGIFVELVDDWGGRISTADFIRKWRALAGDYAGLQSVDVQEFRSGPDGADIHVAANGAGLEQIRRAINQTEHALRAIDGVSNVRNSIAVQSREIQFRINDAGRVLGMTAQGIGRQVKAATNGIVVDTVIDGLSATDVIVRYASRGAAHESLMQLPMQTQDGRTVALYDVAQASSEPAQGKLYRDNGLLSANVKADIDQAVTNNKAVWQRLDDSILPGIRAKTGVDFGHRGKRRERTQAVNEANIALSIGLMSIFLILAWSTSSFTMPFVVMMVLPFGAAGAVIGHWIMGYQLTMISMVALIALLGILVNDSIILLDEISGRHQKGQTWYEATVGGYVRRFRAVFLTTLTTVIGLSPLISETGYQAQFLIPIAITLTWGLAIGTLASFFLIPSAIAIARDLKLLRD